MDLEAAHRAAEPGAPFWDYGIGLKRSEDGEEVAVWIEPHPASSSGDVDAMIAKVSWLSGKLATYPELGRLTERAEVRKLDTLPGLLPVRSGSSRAPACTGVSSTPGRRPAGYEIFNTRDNTRRTEPLDLVNAIRERVDAWRAAGYPGITSITRSLLEHWHDRSARQLPFYFCQLEAIETLIWWVEATAAYRQGIFLPGDGGPWERVCSKMATGTGKTTVMAMIIAWQVLNAATCPKRNKDFSKSIFIVAPGLTVKERLRVLKTGEPGNFYDAFRICPSDSLRQRLDQAEILIDNWHSLMPLKEPERSVVRKGAESDEESPIGSTRYMRTWYTTRPCHPTRKSQISHMVADSACEQYAASFPEKSEDVLAYAKNDHLGFHVYYLWNGSWRRYVPDFLIRLANGRMLVLEIKGEDSDQNRAKRAALEIRVRAINAQGGFGVWAAGVAFDPAHLPDIIAQHMN